LSERCFKLTDPANGMVNCSLGVDGGPTEGDTCVYRCMTRYVLNGNAMRTCGDDGMWTGSDPTCIGKKIQSTFDALYLHIYYMYATCLAKTRLVCTNLHKEYFENIHKLCMLS